MSNNKGAVSARARQAFEDIRFIVTEEQRKPTQAEITNITYGLTPEDLLKAAVERTYLDQDQIDEHWETGIDFALFGKSDVGEILNARVVGWLFFAITTKNKTTVPEASVRSNPSLTIAL